MTRALANGRHFPATGPGWQTRINDALRRAAMAGGVGAGWGVVCGGAQKSEGDRGRGARKEAYGSWSREARSGSSSDAAQRAVQTGQSWRR